jgi:hypothetical protein
MLGAAVVAAAVDRPERMANFVVVDIGCMRAIVGPQVHLGH